MPCVPANCLLCGGSASIILTRKCKYLKRRTTARLGRGGKIREEFGTGSPAERTGGGALALEARVPRFFTRCLHLSRCERWVYGHRQLSKTGVTSVSYTHLRAHETDSYLV